MDVKLYFSAGFLDRVLLTLGSLRYAILPIVETYMPPMMADVMTPATLGPMA